MTRRSTSPAKMFPKRRKVNEIIFAVSETISKMPTKQPMGSLNGLTKNLPPYPLRPSIVKPKNWHAMTEIAAIANVMLTSAKVERRIGTRISWPWWTSQMPMLPNPGISPIQFENNTKKKIVATSGKNLRVFFSSPITSLQKSNAPPIRTSTRFWNPPGTRAYFFLRMSSPIIRRNKTVINDVINVLRTSNVPMWNIVSDANVGGMKSAIIFS